MIRTSPFSMRRAVRPAASVLAVLLAVLLAAVGGGCTPKARPPMPEDPPIVRVLVIEGASQLSLTATEPPLVREASATQAKRLNFPRGRSVQLTISSAGQWQVGNVSLGAGELILRPASDGSLRLNNRSWRGEFRLVPKSAAPGTFDVVNHVDIDGYLKSVVSKELLHDWHDEAYRAQAIVARTYALYEAETAPGGRHFDLLPDVRSQVYGGIDGESTKSVDAVEHTAGVVLTYGPPDGPKIFKTYFSSCCGGVTQSVGDAFNEPNITPLMEQSVGSLCSPSPRFNWGPVEIPKDELTRRIRGWGAKRNRAEKDMATVARIDVAAANQFGRPVRFIVTDAKGARYSLGPEEMRWSINNDAGQGPTVLSGYFRPDNQATAVRFIDGHGWGHGVGMCQWCTKVRATQGIRHEQIVLLAYPKAKLMRAY